MFFIVPVIIQGQTYKPLLVDGNKWNILYEPYPTGWKCAKSYAIMDSIGTEVLSLSSDTIINGIKSRILLKSNDSIPIVSDTLGIIQEDTINKRVYYWSRYYSLFDSLLYDFNIKIKDKVTNGYKNNVVDTIDSINVGTQLRKRIRLNNGVDWIEGVGATDGLISSTIAMPLCGTYYIRTLLCFYNSDSLLYKQNSAEFKDCFYQTTYVGINTKVYQTCYVLYPNPTKDNITVSSINNSHFILEIINTQDQILISRKLINQINQIDLQSLQSGIYFARITNNKDIFIYKIIKE